jgi:hypothetical protein
LIGENKLRALLVEALSTCRHGCHSKRERFVETKVASLRDSTRFLCDSQNGITDISELAVSI